VTIGLQGIPLFQWKIPIADAYVVLNGDGSGMLGAVAPTAGLLSAFVDAVAAFDCGPFHGQPGSILTQFEQASDILSDGSNSSGQTCNAISIGLQFWEATAYDGALPEIPDACPSD
jgi:hypothetical protein